MINQPIPCKIQAEDGGEIEEPHALWINDTAWTDPRVTMFHPCVVIANQGGYYTLDKVAWDREVALKFADQYNRDVLGLTPGCVEAIVQSSMFKTIHSYPALYELNENYKRYDALGWPSERKETIKK